MGVNASTAKAKKGSKPGELPKDPKAHAVHVDKDASMHEAADEAQDQVGQSLDAVQSREKSWRSSDSRPRSALKHSPSARSTGGDSDVMTERTVSGSQGPHRKVSFKVNGGAVPDEAHGPSSKKIKKHMDSTWSMKKLVDTFYGRVLEIKELQPFFEGVDMQKLKNQQEALMLLVFGGTELLEDELPGLSADLRLIHLHLIKEGLNLQHWKMFSDTFRQMLEDWPGIPAETREHANAYMATTRHFFEPLKEGEWPPTRVYRGWTKASCPFAQAAMARRAAEAEAQEAAAAAYGGTSTAAAPAAEEEAEQQLSAAAAAAAEVQQQQEGEKMEQ